MRDFTSNTVVRDHHKTIVHNPIQYPDDWDNYTDERKLEWLRNRSYWREHYSLLSSQRKHLECKIIEDKNDIRYVIIDSIVRNKGDKTEAEQLFAEYLNKKYMFRLINDTTKMMIKMELDKINDYIQYNYYLLSQFGKPVEDCYFNKIILL